MTYSEIYNHISGNYIIMRDFPEQLLGYRDHESTYIPGNYKYLHYKVDGCMMKKKSSGI